MRILITHRYLWPENLALYPTMLKDIADWHRARGDSITILTAAAQDSSDGEKRHAWCRELGIRLIEAPIPIDRGRSAWARAIHTARYAWRMSRLLATETFDFVLVGSYPPIVPAFVARTFRRFGGSKYVYYVQDILPESMETKHPGMRALSTLLKAADAPNMNGSVATITLSESMKLTLAKRGIQRDKIHVLANYAVDETPALCQHSASGRARIIYAGNFGKLQNLAFFLKSAALAAKSADFEIQLLGGGSEQTALEQIAQELNLTNVSFLGLCSREEAQTKIAKADIGLVGAIPGLYDVAFPSKITSYLKAGLPVVVQVDRDTPMGELIDQHKLGVAASPRDVEAAASAIVQVVRQFNDGMYDRIEIVSKAEELFSKQTYFDQYSAVLAQCIEEPSR